MVIEEAAETLEAHIITALTPATQHLILIGYYIFDYLKHINFMY